MHLACVPSDDGRLGEAMQVGTYPCIPMYMLRNRLADQARVRGRGAFPYGPTYGYLALMPTPTYIDLVCTWWTARGRARRSKEL